MKIRHVYFVHNPANNLVKIGASIKPSARKRSLELEEGNELIFLYIFWGGGKNKEKEFHQQFRKYRVHGEWFKYKWRLKWFIGRLKKHNLIWIGKETYIPPRVKRPPDKLKKSISLYRKIKILAYKNSRSVSSMAHIILKRKKNSHDKNTKDKYDNHNFIVRSMHWKVERLKVISRMHGKSLNQYIIDIIDRIIEEHKTDADKTELD